MTLTTNVCKGRTDPKPTGRAICCECGRVIGVEIGVMRCCRDGCRKTVCVPCFDLMPVCFVCHRHMCDDHMVAMADLEICCDCAGDAGIMQREVERFMASLRANRQSYEIKNTQLVNRVDAAAMLAGKAVTP